MKRRLFLLCSLLLFCALPACPHAGNTAAQQASNYRHYLPLLFSPGPTLLIAALHYDGIITGEPDEAFQIYNHGEKPVLLAGWQLRSGTRSVTFPPDMAISPHAFLWCGREAVAFRRSFGHLPGCEWAADTDPSVPNLWGSSLTFSNAGTLVELRRPDGSTADVLVYKSGVPPPAGWHGAAVYPYKPSSAFHEQGQVLYRKLDTRTGLPVPDTDTPADWASDPDDVLVGRHVRYAGWALERFLRPAVGEDTAALQVFVAPDHAYNALAERLVAAVQSIVFEGYTFESAQLAALVAQRARAGVGVTILLEGAPPGGVSDQQRWVVQQMAQAGAHIYYMRSDSKAGVHDRYTNQHAKVWLIDSQLALIGSDNPSPDSFPDDDKTDGTAGRRGVYLSTTASVVVNRVTEIMAADLDPAFADVWSYDPADPDLGAPPADFTPVLTSGGNIYRVRMPEPLALSGHFRFEVCQSPEHALMQDACVLGLVNRAGAGDTLLIEQMSEPLYWGPADAAVASDPNPRLDAYLAAARRGAQVHIILDSFFDDLTSSRSNLRTAEYLTSFARAEGLNLEVRRGNPAGLGLHNKMIIARIAGRGWAMVGSLNGGEASAKLNREVNLLVQSDEVYDYLAGMFWGDWAQ